MPLTKANLEFGLDYHMFIIQYKGNAVVANVRNPKEAADFLKDKETL